MGTMTMNLVQPQTQLILPGTSSAMDKRDSFSSVGQSSSERSRMTTSAYIPEAFKQSFDLNYEVT